jgi:hypothetical protein
MKFISGALFNIVPLAVVFHYTQPIIGKTRTRALANPLRHFHDMKGHHHTNRITAFRLQSSIYVAASEAVLDYLTAFNWRLTVCIGISALSNMDFVTPACWLANAE